MAFVLAFLTFFFILSENENGQLEDLPLADFGRLPETPFPVGKDKVNK